MTLSLRRACAIAAIAVVASLGIAGCSPSPASDTASKSSETKTAAPEKPTRLTADDFVQRLSDAQLKASTGHVVQNMTAQGQTVASTGDMAVDSDPKKMRMHLSTEVGGNSMEMILVDGTIYLSMGEMTQNKFVKISTDDDNPIAAQLESTLSQSNLADQMKGLSAALTDFTVADGTEKIDGVDTTHYVLTVDTKKLFAAQGAEVPAEAGIGDTVTYDMYVGGDDLIRRSVVDMGVMKTTLDYSKWGEPVTIEAPTADQLTEVPGL
ncbi:DUF6612 family protein [Microbacterium sp. NPDC057650]|uniref:DUF7537 family lipoprotein n=1 Tax=unclassified Microbacterium TaxID=2609290 RepID=UPI00366C65C8